MSEYSQRIADLVAGLEALPVDPTPESVDSLMELSAGLSGPYANILRRLDELKVEGLQRVRFPEIEASRVHPGESESQTEKPGIEIKTPKLLRQIFKSDHISLRKRRSQ